jgi:hypothetical protein
VYLYNQNWQGADSAATAVIGNSALFGLDTLNGVFLMNSPEAIWQLQPVNIGANTEDALLFILPAAGPNTTIYPVYLDTALIHSFELNDQRLTHWVGSVSASGTTYYFPFKYKINALNAQVNEYEMVLRLGEQYLIRAEAKTWEAGMGTPAVLADFDTLRSRAGLTPYSGATDKSSMLNALYHERRAELFTEWGQRWLDLKRTGTADAVMSIATPLKGGQWSSSAELYPLPTLDLKADAHLTQNPGYN